jgi:probable phosphoglycerate mutase
MPGGESGDQVLDRYLPVLSELRTHYLDDTDWTRDIVVVSHGAAIRLTAAVLADVASSFVLDHHLANTEAVVLAPEAGGRWRCEQWGALTPPFYPVPDVTPVADAVESGADPMG